MLNNLSAQVIEIPVYGICHVGMACKIIYKFIEKWSSPDKFLRYATVI